jgi:hypothetical protein
LSIEQNLISVAGSEGASAVTPAGPAPCPMLTAFNAPGATVDGVELVVTDR